MNKTKKEQHDRLYRNDEILAIMGVYQNMMKTKKTRHKGDEGTVAFWLYMKALYKDED